jgi:hypothetical protein
MKNISGKLSQMSKGWVVLLALTVFILFMVFVLPGQSAQADEVANEAGTPDLSFWYSKSDLYGMAESYGELGRAEYIKARFTFDLVWPIVYTVFLVTAISWFFGKVFSDMNIWQRANLLPLLAMILDYLENISTSIVMARYPAQTVLVDSLATVFTPAKWLFVGVSFILLLIGIAFVVWDWLKDSQRKQT